MSINEGDYDDDSDYLVPCNLHRYMYSIFQPLTTWSPQGKLDLLFLFFFFGILA